MVTDLINEFINYGIEERIRIEKKLIIKDIRERILAMIENKVDEKIIVKELVEYLEKLEFSIRSRYQDSAY